MSNLEKRLSNLENQMAYIIKVISDNKKYTDYDIDAGRKNTSRAQTSADDANEACINNSKDITDTQNGLVEAYEATETNSDSIINIENAIVEIYEMLTEESEEE